MKIQKLKIKEKKMLLLVSATVIIGIAFIYLLFGFRQKSENRDTLFSQEVAQCLKKKDPKFYGLYSCPYCLKQKKILGDYLGSVTYIECSRTPKLCTEANIRSVPTWIFPENVRKEGLLSLEEIIKLSGCEI